jgi:hypothetical protein
VSSRSFARFVPPLAQARPPKKKVGPKPPVGVGES